MEDKFLFHVFAALSITQIERKATNRHVLIRVVREVEMSTGLEASLKCCSFDIIILRHPFLNGNTGLLFFVVD